MTLPLGNLLTYFVSCLGSVLVQIEFAKPMQHEKCPRTNIFKLNLQNKRPIQGYSPTSSIQCRIHHLVQVDEQYCRTLNNTCFVRVVHTDTGGGGVSVV
jgi:hypothetical protein